MQPTEAERDGERQDAPEREQRVHHDDVAVGQEVGGVTLPRRVAVAEQPADVGVPQAAQLGPSAGTEAVGRVRVPGLIRVDVVPAMVGRPADRSAFEGHGAGAHQREPQRPAGDERAVGQQPVEAHRDAVADDEEQRAGEEHVSEVHTFAPVPDDAEHEDEERCRHEERRDRLLAEARPRRSGGHVGFRRFDRARAQRVQRGRRRPWVLLGDAALARRERAVPTRDWSRCHRVDVARRDARQPTPPRRRATVGGRVAAPVECAAGRLSRGGRMSCTTTDRSRPRVGPAGRPAW